MKCKMDKQFMMECQENLKKEKQLEEEKKKYKFQLGKELNDQIKFKEHIIVSSINIKVSYLRLLNLTYSYQYEQYEQYSFT